MEREALWRKLIATKYGVDKWGWWPSPGPKYRRSSQWGGIVSVGDESFTVGKILSKGVGYVVGEGSEVRFWLDDLVGVGPLCGLFPRVFRVVSNKESTVNEYYEVRDGCPLWSVSFRRSLHPFGRGPIWGVIESSF